MEKEQADIIRQQLQQKIIPYELVEINNTSNQPNVIAIPPTISEDKGVTNLEFNGSPRQERQQKVEQIYDKLNRNPAVPTPENSQSGHLPFLPHPAFLLLFLLFYPLLRMMISFNIHKMKWKRAFLKRI